MPRAIAKKTALAACATLFAPFALAGPPGVPKEAPKAIPKELEPWVPWVLHGAEASRCPFLPAAGANDGDEAEASADSTTRCLWPSLLAVQLGEKSGSFEQGWRVFNTRGGWAALPGDAKSWPQDVRIDGGAAVVSDQSGAPRVYLPAGEHRVTGAFSWSSQPEALQLPAQTGLLALTLRGKAVELPEWDAGGKLWLQRRREEKPEEDRLVVNVVRRLEDQIPAAVVTQLQLAVSGKSREAVLGPALLPGFTATSLESQLPVRLEADGRLRVQLRPGDWTIDLAARSAGPVAALTEPAVPAPWADETVWAFAAQDELRQVTVEGVPAVDPQQTRLPDGWKSLPAYRLRPGDTLKLVEGRRGGADPAPDALHLRRQLWLDHDGRGYTVRDELAGELHQGWRLDASPRLALGRVAVAGRDQLLTRADADGPVGVEIRQGSLAVEADARLEGDVDRLPAVGWRHDFKSVTEELNLPPGWRLLYASGVDSATSWVSSWTLTDLCLLLAAVLAVGKLFGWGWGLAALLTLGLSHQEAGAPHLLWLVALALGGLVRVLPAGKLHKATEAVCHGVGALLVIALALFSVRQLREAVFPVLEEPRQEPATAEWVETASAPAQVASALLAVARAPMAAPAKLKTFANRESATKAKERAAGKAGLLGALGGASDALAAFGAGGLSGQGAPAALAGPMPAAPPAKPSDLSYTLETDPNAQIQTGPGLTNWSWRSVTLGFSGPVEAAQEIRLFLVPPWLERLLGLLRIASCALLAFCVLGLRKNATGGPAPTAPRGAVQPVLGALLLGGLFAGGIARADEPATAPSTGGIIDEMTQRLLERKFPDAAVLDQLKARLLEKPRCAPNCVSLSRMKLDTSDRRLFIELELSAATETAAPLPGDAKQWRPTQVVLDGRPATALWRDGEGTLWIEVGAGLHRVALEGPLPPHDSVTLALPLKPHTAVAALHGWTVGGLQDDGTVDDQLQLSRLARPLGGEPDGESALQPNELPGFALVTRILQLGVRWTVHTEVHRTTPDASALALAVPLLSGESVTSADVHVVGGKVLLNLPAGQSERAWDSLLKPSAKFELAAPRGVPWVEAWRLDASPIWRVEANGIPVIHGEDGSGHRLLEWRPWPGETVTLRASRPAGVPGSTLTIDESTLTVMPGLRSTEAQLLVRLRSSRAGEHELLLPPGAELTSLAIDGQSRPLHRTGRKLSVPLKAGQESLALGWTEKHGPGLLLRAPAVDLGAASVNAWTDVRPANRWLLSAGGVGPMGPVFLIWPLLLLLLGAAVVLVRLRLVPLGTAGWFALGVGFTQAPPLAGVALAAFLLAVGLRSRRAFADDRIFNAGQIALAIGALCAAAALFVAAKTALTGEPAMFIAGNGSGAGFLHWYLDRSGPVLPQPWVLSVPIWVYRSLMLLWAGWLGLACARLAPWAWGSCVASGAWRGSGKLVPSTEP